MLEDRKALMAKQELELRKIKDVTTTVSLSH